MNLPIGRTLVVVAHPDDEILGCGATVARLSAETSVRFLILGEGITSRHSSRDDVLEGALAALRADAMRAAAAVGVEDVVFGDFPDNAFDQVPLLNVVKRVEAELREFAPEVVFTHHPGDLNIDHLITFRAVLTAARPAGNTTIDHILACEIPSSTEWAAMSFGAFRPTLFVDVSDTIERKVKAMQSYESEARPSPHPRAPEMLRGLATTRGAAAGFDHAEAFELVRSRWP